MPTSAQAFFLLRTYVAESPLLPTSTTAKPGDCTHGTHLSTHDVTLWGTERDKRVLFIPHACLFTP